MNQEPKSAPLSPRLAAVLAIAGVLGLIWALTAWELARSRQAIIIEAQRTAGF